MKVKVMLSKVLRSGHVLRLVLLVFVAGLVMSVSGCETMGEDTKKGAGIGALAGAAIGGIVGHQGGHGWEGALIGGATGALAGGLVGNQMDKKQMAENPEHIPLVRIVELVSSGVPDDVIISEIKSSGSKYELNSQTIQYLKDNNVSDAVINYMLST